MHLGLDLGTGLTKLVRSPVDAEHRPSRKPRMNIVPTAVLYRGLVSEIPRPSSGGARPDGTVRCDGFPAMLDAWPFNRVSAWGNRTPAEVVQSFLQCLLGADDSPPGDLVVTTGATAAGASARTGKAVGSTWGMRAELREILSAMGRPPRRVVAAPIAALAYLRDDRPDLAGASRFVVCDVGAGFLSLTLCRVGARATRVADSIRLAGASAWSDDTAWSASTDDRSATLVECLVAALARTKGIAADDLSVRRWRALEIALARQSNANPPAPGGGNPAARVGADPAAELRFADLAVTMGELANACAPLADRAVSALSSLLARQSNPDWRQIGGGSGTRVVLLGGLAGLGPMRTALLRAAGLDPDEPGEAFVELSAVGRRGAAAHGASLIASGQVRLGEPYPHALRLPVHRVVRAQIESSYLELAAAGTIDYEQPEAVLADEEGEPLLITVRASHESAPLPVEIVPDGSGLPRQALLKPSVPPPPGKYRLAVGGGTKGVTVVLHNINGTGSLRYVLEGPADSPGRASTASSGWPSEEASEQ